MFELWALVESDFHSEYGVDLSRRKVRQRMTWRTFRARVIGLLSADTRLSRSFNKGETDERGADDSGFDQGDTGP